MEVTVRPEPPKMLAVGSRVLALMLTGILGTMWAGGHTAESNREMERVLLSRVRVCPPAPAKALPRAPHCPLHQHCPR